MAEPCDLSAVDARRLIGDGSLSPVELFDSCQARIEAVNPAVNAVVAERFEVGRKEAEGAADAVVLFHSGGAQAAQGLPRRPFDAAAAPRSR